MVSSETPQQVEEAEVDQERTLIRDLIQGLKTSLRPLREKVDQLMFYVASRKFLRLSLHNTSSKVRMVH